jgi:hypothetical protein
MEGREMAAGKESHTYKEGQLSMLFSELGMRAVY